MSGPATSLPRAMDKARPAADPEPFCKAPCNVSTSDAKPTAAIQAFTFYEDLRQKQMYRNSLSSLLANCGTSLGSSEGTAAVVAPQRPCIANFLQWQRRCYDIALLPGARPAQAPAHQVAPQQSAADGRSSISPGSRDIARLIDRSSPPSSKVSAAAGRFAVLHRRARSMDGGSVDDQRRLATFTPIDCGKSRMAESLFGASVPSQLADIVPVAKGQLLPVASPQHSDQACRIPSVVEPLPRNTSPDQLAVKKEAFYSSTLLLPPAALSPPSVSPPSGCILPASSSDGSTHYRPQPTKLHSAGITKRRPFVDESNYVLTTFHTRSSSGLAEDRGNKTKAGLAGSGGRTAKSLEDLCAVGTASQPAPHLSPSSERFCTHDEALPSCEHRNTGTSAHPALSSSSAKPFASAREVVHTCDGVYENVFSTAKDDAVIYANVGHAKIVPVEVIVHTDLVPPHRGGGVCLPPPAGECSADEDCSGDYYSQSSVLASLSSLSSSTYSPQRLRSSSASFSSSIDGCDKEVALPLVQVRNSQPPRSECARSCVGAAASSPIYANTRSDSIPLYANVHECLPRCCSGATSPPLARPVEVNYAELVHPTICCDGRRQTAASNQSSLCLPPRSKREESGVVYAEINIAATDAAHKALLHQTKYRQEQRNILTH